MQNKKKGFNRDFEEKRRQIFSDVKDISYFINDKLKQLMGDANSDNEKSSGIKRIKTEFNNRIQ